MVITTSEASTASEVSTSGCWPARSMPTSAIASTAAGLTCSAGSEPAERTSTASPPSARSQPAAIWERPALCTQTNRTLGRVIGHSWRGGGGRGCEALPGRRAPGSRLAHSIDDGRSIAYWPGERRHPLAAGRGLLHPAGPPPALRRGGRRPLPGAQGDRRPGAAATAVPGRRARRRGGVRLRPDRAVGPVPADGVAPPQGAGGRRAAVPRQARRVGVLRAGAGRAGRAGGGAQHRGRSCRRSAVVHLLTVDRESVV